MYDFFSKLSKIINTGKSHSVILSGNVQDLFYDGEEFVPLVNFLVKKGTVPSSETTRGVTVVLYEINRAVRIIGDEKAVHQAWADFKGVKDGYLETLLKESKDSPTVAVEVLRQMTICSRTSKMNSQLLIVIEGAEMLLPRGEYGTMNFADRKRIAIFNDWFSDPEFMNAHDSVILISESRSQLHQMVSTLPQVLEVNIPSPSKEERRLFGQKFLTKKFQGAIGGMIPEPPFLEMTASLSLHAYRQLLCEPDAITAEMVIDKVEEFMKSQLGEDVIEFKRPTHTLESAVGFSQLKKFIRSEMIPRFKAGPEEALPGAAIAGPIGGGKTYLMEGMASELGIPVIVLKNLRSMYFGQTDVIFERLRRTLEALDKVAIFVDEADTQFGDVGPGAHETEKRLTGKIQQMMSDPKLKGKVIWLLMTARINLLSPDIRRPGRVGDLIIPILDPEGEDRIEFVKWCFKSVMKENDNPDIFGILKDLTAGYSAASFSALRSLIKSVNCQSIEDVIKVAEDLIPPDIGTTRRYQILQALQNCTRKSLLPKSLFEEVDVTAEPYTGKIIKGPISVEKLKEKWAKEIEELESKGVNYRYPKG